MKTRIVKGRNIGTYEVEYKLSWISPWRSVYADNGLPFPWRGSYEDAERIEVWAKKKLRG